MSGPQRSRAGGVRDFPPQWQEEAGVLERRILGRSGNGISCGSLTRLQSGFVVGRLSNLRKITSTKLRPRRQAVCMELSTPVSFRVFPKILRSPVIAAYSHRGKVSVSVLTRNRKVGQRSWQQWRGGLSGDDRNALPRLGE